MLRPAQPARTAPDSRRWRCAQADARAKEAKLKAAQAGGFGDVSIAAQLEEQRNSMIAMAQELYAFYRECRDAGFHPHQLTQAQTKKAAM